MARERPEEAVRAFIAVELPSNARRVLGRLVESLRGQDLQCLRLVNPDGIHLTLKFLGQVPVPRLHAVADAMNRAAAGAVPFEIELQGLGGFPNLEAPRVLWVGIGGNPAPLAELAGTIDGELTRLGFPPESRPFAPHLTLARVREGTPRDQRRRAGDALGQFAGQERAHLPVAGISLMRSVLLPEGAHYTPLHHAALGDGPAKS